MLLFSSESILPPHKGGGIKCCLRGGENKGGGKGMKEGREREDEWG